MIVFDKGKHFADYTYNTIEECLDDLTKVVWIFLKPNGEWTKDQILRYTENWFAKSIDTFNMECVPIHEKYSYLHSPKLVDMSPLDSVFNAIYQTMPKEYL